VCGCCLLWPEPAVLRAVPFQLITDSGTSSVSTVSVQPGPPGAVGTDGLFTHRAFVCGSIMDLRPSRLGLPRGVLGKWRKVWDKNRVEWSDKRRENWRQRCG